MKAVDSVAVVLERELGPTVTEWLRWVNRIPDLTKIALSDADRTGHLPRLFEDLIARLRLDLDAKPSLSIAAAAHSKTRFGQGYSIPMLVEESRIFQVGAFGTLHTHHRKLNQNQVLLDVITLAHEADRQLTQSVLGFMAAQAAA